MMAALKFIVRRHPAVLVAPVAPTPRELKRLSDIDDHDRMRFHVSAVQFYRRNESKSGVDPTMVIRHAIAKALVHYYPLAGRLIELEGRKLAVDCTGDGVLFIEADIDIRLEQFGDALLPPFPCIEELFPDAPGSFSDILDASLLLFQVTRLACGGFILAVRINHTMFDGQGLTQFLGAVAELARGVLVPTIRPIWQRELLEARNPPRPSFPHPEFDEVPDANSITMPFDQMVCHTFLFGPKDVATLRAQLTAHLQKIATSYAVELIKKAKDEVDIEYMRSMADITVLQKRVYNIPSTCMYLVADTIRAKWSELDFGWGKPVYHGPAEVSGIPLLPWFSSFLLSFKNAKGEECVALPMFLPAPAMERVMEEMDTLLRAPASDAALPQPNRMTRSAL
ncbi:hypothetical protein QOZ80_3BG0291310 [Eleusine coracana subsp. coracana]|nr:hypothetical protein QOZ80_3BG0291310 [Eleusine coracana subsp. coracana]